MEQKIDVHALNKNGDSPIDLAIRFGQDAVVHLFLGTARRLKIELPTQDLEGHFYKCLKEAKQESLLEEQIFFLEKLSDIYIEKQDFVTGAKILNSALALLKNNPLFEKHLLAKLERIEGLFLESQGIKTDVTRRNYLVTYRAWLKASREQCVAAFTKKEPIQNILKDLTHELKTLLKVLIAEAQRSLGHPPIQWACMGMGSMSRGEMCPYSDIEFAFLIAKEIPEALAYFRILSQLLELQIINLGETKFPIFGEREPSPTPNGFCMDIGGNTPLGMPGVYELIGTPKQLARFQTPEWIDQNIILANASNAVCWVAGDQKLVDMYIQEKTVVQKLKQNFFGSENREKLALRLLAVHLTEFAPNLSKSKEEDNAFGIKKELYRPLQEILSSLALFYHLKTTNTFERIDELVEKGVFSAKGAEHLKYALRKVLTLRLEAHLFYQDEKEFLCHLEEGKPQEPQLLYITPEHSEHLHEIYKVLIPFHRSFKEFFSTKQKQTLKHQLFYDEGPLVRAETLQKTLQYTEAQAAYQQAVSLNPNDIDALFYLGEMEFELGHAEEALKRSEKAVAQAKRAYGEEHPDVAKGYNNIGLSLRNQGKYDEALVYLQKALKTSIIVLGEKHPCLGASYSNIGLVLRDQGKYDEALVYFLRFPKKLNI